MLEQKEEKKIKKVSGRYIESLGGRKRAHARVRITEDEGATEKLFTVNDREVQDYFPTEASRLIAREALSKIKALNRFHVSARIFGGGFSAQAEALRHGVARALVEFNAEWRSKLKRSDFLKRDPRKKERKKFGLKKARKSPQWSKR